MLIKRLKEARLRAGLSQYKLGVLAGLDEATSSTRMNQYEKGKHQADLEMAMRIAKVLDFININQITDAWLLSVAQMVRNRRGRSYDPIGENSHISLIY